MTEPSLEALQRENLYLRPRNLQLQADVTDLSAENGRLREQHERLHGRVAMRQANPLGGGQGA